MEKMTTLIRRTYRYRPSTAFFFGQVWSSSYMYVMQSCQISSLAISTYSQTMKEVLFHNPSRMNDLGRKIDVFPISDEAAKAVSGYAQGEYGFEDLNLDRIWCGYFDGNEKSRRVQEKCGFHYHHTSENVPCALEGVLRTEHVSCLSREEWEEGCHGKTV